MLQAKTDPAKDGATVLKFNNNKHTVFKLGDRSEYLARELSEIPMPLMAPTWCFGTELLTKRKIIM